MNPSGGCPVGPLSLGPLSLGKPEVVRVTVPVAPGCPRQANPMGWRKVQRWKPRPRVQASGALWPRPGQAGEQGGRRLQTLGPVGAQAGHSWPSGGLQPGEPARREAPARTLPGRTKRFLILTSRRQCLLPQLPAALALELKPGQSAGQAMVLPERLGRVRPVGQTTEPPQESRRQASARAVPHWRRFQAIHHRQCPAGQGQPAGSARPPTATPEPAGQRTLSASRRQ
jgi:hypothetical protein